MVPDDARLSAHESVAIMHLTLEHSIWAQTDQPAFFRMKPGFLRQKEGCNYRIPAEAKYAKNELIQSLAELNVETE